MAIQASDVTARWPMLASLFAGDTIGAIDTALADAALQVDVATWGPRATLATIHLAAHALFLAHPELSPSGPVQSESAGGVSRSYAVTAVPGGSSYASTAAGREYLRLRSQLGLGAMVV